MFRRLDLSIFLAVTITADVVRALSIHRRLNINPSCLLHNTNNNNDIISSKTALHLGPIDDLSDYGKEKQSSELDSLISKRDQIRQKKIANTKPDDDSPPIQEMSDEEIQAMFAKKKNTDGADEEDGGGEEGTTGGGLDVDDLFSKDYVPDFKTKRSGPSNRGLSGGESGGILDDPNASEEEDGKVGMFVDWAEDHDDENEFHIPNRIGFSTVDWGNGKAGFVSGKLKKKDRKAGKFNKADMRVS